MTSGLRFIPPTLPDDFGIAGMQAVATILDGYGTDQYRAGILRGLAIAEQATGQNLDAARAALEIEAWPHA